jgi:hypothetical protein
MFSDEDGWGFSLPLREGVRELVYLAGKPEYGRTHSRCIPPNRVVYRASPLISGKCRERLIVKRPGEKLQRILTGAHNAVDEAFDLLLKGARLLLDIAHPGRDSNRSAA